MTNKLPEIGKRYKEICSKHIIEVVFICEEEKQCVAKSGRGGLWVQHIPTFFEHFEELPGQPTSAKIAQVNLQLSDEVKEAMEELNAEMDWSYDNSTRNWKDQCIGVTSAAQNLLKALDDSSIPKKDDYGISEYTINSKEEKKTGFKHQHPRANLLYDAQNFYHSEDKLDMIPKRELKSIWKDVSELKEPDSCIVEWNGGAGFDFGSLNLSNQKIHVLQKGPFDSKHVKRFCYLSDFINDYEAEKKAKLELEERVRKLEGK